LLAGSLPAQTISKQEAQELLQKVINSLQNSDQASFVNLWYLDNTGNPYDNSIFDRQQVAQQFQELKQFLAVPLEKNLAFHTIEIEQMSEVLKSKYKIKAWFKIDDSHYEAYGFLVDYINGKWVFRWHGETTISEKAPVV
jgi:hypothetical protein